VEKRAAAKAKRAAKEKKENSTPLPPREEAEDVTFMDKSSKSKMTDILTMNKQSEGGKKKTKGKAKAKKKDNSMADVLKMAGGVSAIDFS
jgi:hypothetical protein